MKRKTIEEYVGTLIVTIVIFSSFFPSKVFAGNKNQCQEHKCLEDKAKLEELGYESSVAERIAIYRPDLSHLITSSEVKVHPEGFVHAPIFE